MDSLSVYIYIYITVKFVWYSLNCFLGKINFDMKWIIVLGSELSSTITSSSPYQSVDILLLPFVPSHGDYLELSLQARVWHFLSC